MSVELLTIVAPVVKAVAPEIARKINSALNPTDLEKALKAGVKSTDEWDNEQSYQQHLFYHCDDKQARELLDQFFKDTGVQEELQKPFTEKTTPNLQVLIKIFHKIKSDKPNLKFHDESIEHWLKKFADAYFEHTNTYLKFQIAKSDYLKQLSRYFDGVEFVGIKVKTKEEEKFAKLPQIFVMPNVVEQVEVRASTGLKSNLDLALEETASQQRQQILLWEQQSSGKKFSAQELLKESTRNKFVVLGEPGIGKTTLMSYFAVMLAEQQTEKLGLSADLELLPILIRIRDLGKAPTNNVKELPKGFFEHWLEDGRALILLDGLDEIAKPSDRYEFVKIIHSFLGQYSQNRAIITSRPVGYNRGFFGTDEFPHYQLEKFDDSQIDLFIQQWYNSRLPNNPEKAQERQESLKKALATQERIKLLARNPLLLTIIALIHRYDARLPKQRYKLYEQAVDTLLINWDVNKGIESWKLNYIQLDDIKILMQNLAYWIHSQGVTGDKEGGTLIDRDELITQLSQYICEYNSQVQRHQAKAEAERLVDHITERCGLLNEQGQDRYAFVHKTFQEYLAGEKIRDRQSGDFNEVLNHVRDYLHNSHWREVLLLLIAQQNPKNLKRIIEAILQQETPYEEWLHRNLLFAGTCLAEDLKLSDGNLITDILQRLVELEVSNSRLVGAKVKSQVFQIFCNLNETQFQAQALQLLKASADFINENRLREYRAALGEQQEVLAELLGLLKDESEIVRYSAAQALGNLGNASPQVVEALLALLKDETERVRYSAAEALGNLGNASPQVVEALLSLFKDETESVRNSAAEALGKLGNASPQVVEALLSLLKDETEGVRSFAAKALGNLGNASPQVVEALLGLLKDDSGSVRYFAAEALGKLGNASPQVVEALLSLFKDDSDIVRYFAAEALGKLGNASPQVVEALLGLLKDDSWSVRYSAAEALGNLGSASPQVVEALLGLLKDDSESVRLHAAEALGKLGSASPQVVEALLGLLKDDSGSVRYFAAGALGKLGSASPKVVEALLGLLKDDSGSVRYPAAEALGKLGKNSTNVTGTVAKWISQNQDSEYVGNGIDTLWNLVVTEE
ncbi:HEAT repeat domain-containing protein [Nostocales cyanobacterium LEGE 12452]|nr:HEAT repeat domain-containing protein [Nostocales cyanobacterium LEGE 12452]